ncbi:MAG: Gfo/Idh/MocA family oxidoreductase [Planctomycetia bacterium]|nr:Gfo/Idh/MocA family oxidoreductase [Planctomycetia bacterium]
MQASANEKLNIGASGVGGKGVENLNGVSSQNIVALCDIDENSLGKAAETHPKADKYHDFRKLLERKDRDAVVISTPDHTHAPAAAAGRRRQAARQPRALRRRPRQAAGSSRRRQVATAAGSEVRRVQGTGTVRAQVRRPLCRLDRGLLGRAAGGKQFQRCWPAHRDGLARQRRLARRQETDLG